MRSKDYVLLQIPHFRLDSFLPIASLLMMLLILKASAKTFSEQWENPGSSSAINGEYLKSQDGTLQLIL